jgi:hypothetical protein
MLLALTNSWSFGKVEMSFSGGVLSMSDSAVTADDVYAKVCDYFQQRTAGTVRGPMMAAVDSWILRTVRGTLQGATVQEDVRKKSLDFLETFRREACQDDPDMNNWLLAFFRASSRPAEEVSV